MSRGKIYRTKLVKTDAGYVAKNETFAQLQRIIIDQAISPRRRAHRGASQRRAGLGHRADGDG